MTEQNNTNWLEQEEQEIAKQMPTDFEKFPTLKLTPNVVIEIIVDFSKQFEKWTDEEANITKKIIPVTLNGVRHNWWLNVKNPVYKEIIKGGKSGQTTFKILQTGTQAQTKYVLVK